MPDSISKVALTRSFRLTPLPLSIEKTAAASVDPTIAPTNKPSKIERLNIHMASRPVNPEVINTPPVASTKAGRKPTLKVFMRVRIPPSSKITASAKLPIT